MFKKVLFVGLVAALAMWVTGCDPRGIKEVLDGMSSSNAQNMTGGNAGSDWGS